MITTEQKEGLIASISKWDRVANRLQTEGGVTDCSLCMMYYESADADSPDCLGCPISEDQHTPYCGGTPYAAWHRHQNRAHDSFSAPGDGLSKVYGDCTKCQALAESMRDYLQELLESSS